LARQGKQVGYLGNLMPGFYLAVFAIFNATFQESYVELIAKIEGLYSIRTL